mgnify:CR=1 FL=1
MDTDDLTPMAYETLSRAFEFCDVLRAEIGAAAAEFSELAVCPLGEGVVTTPAFVGGRIYIRGGAHLYGVGAAGP